MNRKLAITAFTALLYSCDGPSEETVYENVDLNEATEEIVLHSETSYWLTYEGTIPCGDCSGIRMELKLENNASQAMQRYELSETYLGTSDGDRTFVLNGQTEVSYGIEGEPNVFVVNLLNEDLEVVYRFIQDIEGNLHLLDKQGNRIKSELNYTLEKK